MALIVEDGTGKSDAESYISVADADTYHAAQTGTTDWSGATTDNKEMALRRATRYLDSVYRLQWQGQRKLDTQVLDWPRYNVYDADDFDVDCDSLPAKLEQATAEMALLALSEDLLPDLSDPGTVKASKVKVGPIEESVTYAGGGNEPFKRYRKAELLLQEFMVDEGGEVVRS